MATGWVVCRGLFRRSARLWFNVSLPCPVDNVSWNPCFFHKFSVTFVTFANACEQCIMERLLFSQVFCDIRHFCKCLRTMYHGTLAFFTSFMWHSSLFETCLVKCEHSYTDVKRRCPIICDIRHFSKQVLSSMTTVTQIWNVNVHLLVTFVLFQSASSKVCT